MELGCQRIQVELFDGLEGCRIIDWVVGHTEIATVILVQKDVSFATAETIRKCIEKGVGVLVIVVGMGVWHRHAHRSWFAKRRERADITAGMFLKRALHAELEI